MTEGGRLPPPWHRRLYDQPYLLLTLAVAFWAGNFVLGRAVRDVVPPVTLAFWRWTLAAAVVSPVAAPRLRAAWPTLRAHARLVALLAFLGVAVFNTLIYLGLHATTAVNAVLLQSTMPVMIVLLALAIDGARLRTHQVAGIALSLAGATWVLVRGDVGALGEIRLSGGDALILLAVVCYAAYSVLLRRRPALDPFLFFNRGVELAGPARAGTFIHLMPLFGSALSVALLGEALRPYHGVGIVAILGGIALATRVRSKAA